MVTLTLPWQWAELPTQRNRAGMSLGQARLTGRKGLRPSQLNCLSSITGTSESNILCGEGLLIEAFRGRRQAALQDDQEESLGNKESSHCSFNYDRK